MAGLGLRSSAGRCKTTAAAESYSLLGVGSTIHSRQHHDWFVAVKAVVIFEPIETAKRQFSKQARQRYCSPLILALVAR